MSCQCKTYCGCGVKPFYLLSFSFDQYSIHLTRSTLRPGIKKKKTSRTVQLSMSTAPASRDLICTNLYSRRVLPDI